MQPRQWVSRSEWLKQKRAKEKRGREWREQQEVASHKAAEEYYEKQRTSRLAGNRWLGSGFKTKKNPFGAIGHIPYWVWLFVWFPVFGILYKLSFGWLPLALLVLLAVVVGLCRLFKK